MTPQAASAASRRPRLPKGEGQRLRGEIMAAAERMLIETGSQEAVSIRAVADAVGVTPPSIYRHFADKSELIFEVCARHFGALTDHVRAACEGADDPVERLAALGRAYIDFAVANPEPYRIMFMSGPDDVPAVYQGPGLARSAAFDLLVQCVQDCIDAGRFRPDQTDAYRLALGFWARVHGLTSLRIAKPNMDWPDDPGFVDDYLDVCLWGVVRDDDR